MSKFWWDAKKGKGFGSIKSAITIIIYLIKRIDFGSKQLSAFFFGKFEKNWSKIIFFFLFFFFLFFSIRHGVPQLLLRIRTIIFQGLLLSPKYWNGLQSPTRSIPSTVPDMAGKFPKILSSSSSATAGDKLECQFCCNFIIYKPASWMNSMEQCKARERKGKKKIQKIKI